MNKIITCKYVNTLFNTNATKSQFIAKQYTQTTELRSVLDDIAKKWNISHLNDWYKLPTKDYPKLFAGSSDLQNHASQKDFSPLRLLSSVYPEHDWLPWKFERCPQSYWEDIKNVRKFMDWAGKELGVKEMSDWYNVMYMDIIKIGGRNLLKLKSSHIEILAEVYPDYDWLPWKFEQCPKGYWNDINNVRKYMDWAGKQLNVKEMSDWYNVSYMDLYKTRGGGYLLHTKPSFVDLLKEVYPEYDWLPWRFGQCTKHFWNDPNNARKFMDWAGKQLGVKKMSDWYNISYMDLSKLGGDYLLRLKTSYVDLLTEVYPEYDWLLWRFTSFSSKSLLTEPIRRNKFIKSMADKLNIKDMSDWYKIKAEQIIDLKGGILLVQSHTLPKLLSAVYPEYKWEESKFEQQQSDIWTDIKLANYFAEWLKNQDEKVASMVCKYVKEAASKGQVETDALTLSLQRAFPNKWIKATSLSIKRSQYLLKECITSIFNRDANKNTIIMEEYKHPDVSTLELDYFLPEYKIAFEYQGQQHYRTVSLHNRKESIDVTRERDRNKLDSCKELGITLIEVPYWWDKKISSLAATIYNERPDLFNDKPQGDPIPLNLPSELSYKNSKNNVSKKVLITATLWDYDKMEPNGWFMTEKYDGIRFYWDGTQCYSRQGNKINIPLSLSSQLPPVALDGELWTQYGLFQEAVQLVLTNKEEKWNKATFWIFDAPKLEKPLEKRIEFLQQLNLPSFAKVVEFVKCESKEHLKQFNDAIIAKGGEGVMLREPESMYKPGRSTSLRKYKPFYDTEVRVLKNQYPQGFVCEQPNGKIVYVNSENSEEAKAVKKGAVITIKHSGTNVYGTLLYPQFYRERLDVSWNDLLNKTV